MYGDGRKGAHQSDMPPIEESTPRIDAALEVPCVAGRGKRHSSRLGGWMVLAAMLLALPVNSLIAEQQVGARGARADSGAVFRGRVVQAVSGAPIAGADVWIISLEARGATDSAGAFLFRGLRAGLQLVEIRRVGYVVLHDTLRLASDHENVRTYALSAQSTTLDTVKTVAAARKYLSPRLQAFEERRLSGQGGHFLSDSVFRRNENTTLGNLVESRVPGLTLLRGTTLVSTRKQCRGLVILGPRKPSSCRSGGAQDCYVAIYVDGTLYYRAEMADQGIPPPDFSRAFDVSNFAGAEFYADGAAAPASMHSDDDGCGSLWLWTRER
jgi:hypothetical protein